MCLLSSAAIVDATAANGQRNNTNSGAHSLADGWLQIVVNVLTRILVPIFRSSDISNTTNTTTLIVEEILVEAGNSDLGEVDRVPLSTGTHADGSVKRRPQNKNRVNFSRHLAARPGHPVGQPSYLRQFAFGEVNGEHLPSKRPSL